MKKYILCPREIVSKTDNQIHYISAMELAALYGVSMEECYIEGETFRLMDGRNFVWLYPLYNGDYNLEKVINDKHRRDTLAKILEVWDKYPALRLGQLLVNASTPDLDLFYIPDDKLVKFLEAFDEIHRQGN